VLAEDLERTGAHRAPAARRGAAQTSARMGSSESPAQMRASQPARHWGQMRAGPHTAKAPKEQARRRASAPTHTRSIGIRRRRSGIVRQSLSGTCSAKRSARAMRAADGGKRRRGRVAKPRQGKQTEPAAPLARKTHDARAHARARRARSSR
jgi:hypothetical protein